MTLEGLRKILTAVTAIAGIVILALYGMIPGEWAASSIAAIALGHNAWQAFVDRGRPPAAKPEPRSARKSIDNKQLGAALARIAETFERKD